MTCEEDEPTSASAMPMADGQWAWQAWITASRLTVVNASARSTLQMKAPFLVPATALRARWRRPEPSGCKPYWCGPQASRNYGRSALAAARVAILRMTPPQPRTLGSGPDALGMPISLAERRALRTSSGREWSKRRHMVEATTCALSGSLQRGSQCS